MSVIQWYQGLLFPSFQSEIFFCFLRKVAPAVSRWGVLYDARFEQDLIPQFRQAWHKQGEAWFGIPVVARESRKTLKEVQRVSALLSQEGFLRHTSGLLVLGGGLLGDLGGLVAGLFHRGLPWVNLPTTLLAQTDSCLGGKTGVNLGSQKNALGLFHPPLAIFSDPHFLSTLSSRDLLSGWGEMFKYGLLFDPKLFEDLQQAWKKSKVPPLMLLKRCLQWKKKIIRQDPLEKNGQRALLNLGHTLGHALEGATQYRFFRHGEAVLWGLQFALLLSEKSFPSAQKELKKARLWLNTLPLPWPKIPLETKHLLAFMQGDKKNLQSSAITFVLLKALGQPVLNSSWKGTPFTALLQSFLSKQTF